MMVMGLTRDISHDKIIGIAYAAVLFGETTWARLPALFNSLESTTLDTTISYFASTIITEFGLVFSKWTCINWRYLEE
jgi:hypothetical protein